VETALARPVRLTLPWLESPGVFAFGFLVITLVAGHTGGFLPTTYGWTAIVTLWLAAMALLLRDRPALGGFDLLFLGGLVAFTGWVALSNLWTSSMTSTMHEVQRDVAYVGIVGSGLLLTRRATVPYLLGGVLAGIALLSAYALGVRILPDRFGDFDSTSFGYRLATPITYWNGLGIFAVLGTLLALGFVARGERLVSRATAAAALPVLVATMFFTFSRGSWVALGVGLVVAVLVDPHRLQLLAAWLAVAPWPALALVLAAGADGLTTRGASLEQATADGHALVLPLALLAGAAAASALTFALAERRVRPAAVVRRAFAAVLVAALLAGGGAVWRDHGSPWSLAERGWSSFKSPPKESTAEVTNRLFQLSSNGRIDLWTTSWDAFERDPLRGSGAGTFWQSWASNGDRLFETTQGHSVYMEVLGELGAPGLAFLVLGLAAALAAGVWARRAALVPAALGAFVAWATHAGVDWDWELVGVTGAALLVGVGLTRSVEPRGPALRGMSRVAALLAATLLAAAAVPPQVAALRLRDADRALVSNPEEALRSANVARRFAPWSSEPDEVIGDALRTQRQLAAAERAYRAALAAEPSDWRLWAKLSDVTSGAKRRQALERAHALNPRVKVAG
jgi:hypothetical protein